MRGLARLLIASLLFSSAAYAQGIRLTPQQQQMLDSLPPAQRQQALEAIDDLARQQGVPLNSINEQSDLDEFDSLDDGFEEFEEEEAVDTVPRAKARSRLVLTITPKASLPPVDVEALSEDPAIVRIIGNNLFILDDDGVLSLQGLGDVPLLGLVQDDIKRRLSAEAYLGAFDIEARILGQKPIGVEALRPFGYDVLEPKKAMLRAPTSGPVPPDYVLGPGDTVRVQLFGNVNGIFEYEISRDGILNLPEIGPITAAGMPFSEFRADLKARVQQMLIGTQASITMGRLRTIRVYVLGDVNEPGSYVVSGLATIAGALYRARGVADVGSLRDIQLKRNGDVVARLDLYDLLISGDTSGNQRLRPGDVVFVPPIGPTVSVAGAVKRPAIYELKGPASVDYVVGIAGGLTNDADGAGAWIERIENNRQRGAHSANLDDAATSAIKLRDGDKLVVPEVLPDLENAVTLSGHVFRQGTYAWRPGMRLSNLIRSADELKPGVDMHYVLIRREKVRGNPIDAISADLAAALAMPGSDKDPVLSPRDQIFVFSLELGRQRVVTPIVEELRLQATHDAPARQVQVSGQVRVPGVYPLEPGMRVSDLVRAGGSLSEEAYALYAELTRYTVVDGESRIVDVIEIDLARAISGDASANIALSPHDYLRINQVPEWNNQWSVTLVGEVRFPGEYRVKRGESLAEVLERAGGLTESAFAEGAVFLRKSLRRREQEQIEVLARRLESDLASLSLQSASGSETLSTGKVLLEQLRSTEAVGRLVIGTEHLDSEDKGRIAASIELQDGDRLMVPTRSQVVTVIGETQQNTSHLFRDGLARNDYIFMSGGFTRRADKSRVYVVRANGAVVTQNRSSWLGRGGQVAIRPGDTIVVPLDADRIRPLTFWTNVTQILYQGAIAVAAVQSFN